MKPSPLLDFWQKPADAGDPVAMFATTFAIEPDFFEQSCLARFLEVSSVSEGTGSVDDVVANIELHELLQKTIVTVLADRSARAERTSPLWDLLSCHVKGGLLHAKVVILIWENATRVILGSANLTAAGYRRQIELGLAADLGRECLLPPEVLMAIAAELESYAELVPGYDPDIEVFIRARRTLELFRDRVKHQATHPARRTTMRVAFAPTNASTRPLDQIGAVWQGPQPIRATHLSPFWDSNDPAAVNAVCGLLTGRPARSRSQRVAVVLGLNGQTSFSLTLAKRVDSVRELKALDQEVRLLHAKCLLIESDQWVAALVGSSNHTRAGLGLGTRRHREVNVWLGAPRHGKEGRSLLELIRLGKAVPADAQEVDPVDEDEIDVPALPTCFGICLVTRSNESCPWELSLGISTDGMPQEWSIGLTPGNVALTRQQWEARGGPETTIVSLGQSPPPTYILVCFDGVEVPWAVLADDRLALPPGPALASLRAQQLLEALATGRSLGDIVREGLDWAVAESKVTGGIVVDPLKRLEIKESLLRQGRALAASLTAMQRRLDRQVLTLDTLRARLEGPLGPEFVATKVVEACQNGEQTRAQALFTVAEIALVVGRVRWSDVLEHVDGQSGRKLVDATLDRLEMLHREICEESTDLASYAERAMRESRRCLIF